MNDASNRLGPEIGQAREQFLALVAAIRPALHRYCARLVGSVVEGEDLVQETLARAFYALSLRTDLPPLRPWLFRIAHNTAVDFLRRYEHRYVAPHADPEVLAASEEPLEPPVLRAALASFLTLPVAQRSAVILKDVLDHSLEETADTMATTVPAVKAALSRGRAALRDQLQPARPPSHPKGDPAERLRLQSYVAMFNARNWDGLRALMAEECRLDLVAKAARHGAEVSGYFARYATDPNAHLALGSVEGQPALLFLPKAGQPPAYFILLQWNGDRVALIRDFRYVSYIAQEAALELDNGSADAFLPVGK